MKYFYFLLILSISLAFDGCKKKDDKVVPTATTVAEDKAKIKSTFTDLSSCVTQIRDAEGTKVITDFFKLENGEVNNADWIEDVVQALGDELDLSAADNSNRFDFNANTGTYTYNSGTKTWTKSSLPSDAMVVKFPSKETGVTNNATLTMSQYKDQDVTINGEHIFLPKLVAVNLVVDGVEVLKIDGNATYDDPIPIDVNLSLMVKPFTYSITGHRITPTKFTAALNITNGSGCNTKATVDFEFTHSDYETMDLDKDVKALTLTAEHNGLKIISSIDMLSLSAIDKPTETQINTYAKTNIYSNGEKIGELEFYENPDTDTKVRVIYKDGSKEDADVYFKPFLDDLEKILQPNFGEVELN